MILNPHIIDIAFQMFIEALPPEANGVVPKYIFAKMIQEDYFDEMRHPLYEYYVKAKNKIREDKLKRIANELE